VLEADDSPMTVKTALQLINAGSSMSISSDIQGEFEPETRFSISWYEQHGMWHEGDYGTADNLARARSISVDEREACRHRRKSRSGQGAAV
jgi:putative DNA methylase